MYFNDDESRAGGTPNKWRIPKLHVRVIGGARKNEGGGGDEREIAASGDL